MVIGLPPHENATRRAGPPEIDDLQALGVRTRVNGETVQNGTTAEMIFGRRGDQPAPRS